MNNHERENYGWGLLQDMIEREIHSAFQLRKPQDEEKRKENRHNPRHSPIKENERI